MDQEPAGSAQRSRRSLMPMLLLPIIAFIAGLAAMGWLLANWAGGASWLGVAPEVTAPAAEPAPAIAVEPEPQAEPAASPQQPERLLIDPEITRRVNLLEEKLNALDLQSRAAVGNADRAEGLLVAFAARRALDSGVPLGYIEGLLSQRFGSTQRQAVATILTAARTPVTLQELQEDLQQVGPQLLGGGPDQSWWSAFRNELGGLVIIRKSGTPSPLPAEILRRATQRLEAGQVKVALAEVLRLPNRDKASDWIVKARHYIAARTALDQIEASALLAPSAPLPPAAPTRQQPPAKSAAQPRAAAVAKAR